jgi:hypothetical protein
LTEPMDFDKGEPFSWVNIFYPGAVDRDVRLRWFYRWNLQKKGHRQ